MKDNEMIGIHFMFVLVTWFIFLLVSKIGAVHQSFFGYYYVYELFSWIALGIAMLSVILFIKEIIKK